MYKIHKGGWSAATKEDINRFLYLEGYPNCTNVQPEYLEVKFDDNTLWNYTLSGEGVLSPMLDPMRQEIQDWALEVGLLGKTQLEWVKRDDHSQRSDHYYAFVPTNEDGSAGFVLQAAYNYAWKGKPEVYQIAIYAVAHDKPVDISKNCIGPVLLHEVLDGMTYLDQPAPMIEAEQALRQILKGGLNQLQFTV